MTTTTPPRPTSSRPRPTLRDDLPQVTSSLVPLPTGGRGHWSRQTDHTNQLVHPLPGTRSRTTSHTPTHTRRSLDPHSRADTHRHLHGRAAL